MEVKMLLIYVACIIGIIIVGKVFIVPIKIIGKLIINSILLIPKSSASNSFCRANRITMKCSKKLRMTKKYCTP